MTFPLTPLSPDVQGATHSIPTDVSTGVEQDLFNLFFELEVATKTESVNVAVEAEVAADVEIGTEEPVIEEKKADTPEIKTAQPKEVSEKHPKTLAETAFAPIVSASAQTTSKEGKVPSISSSYPATLPPNQSSEKTSTVPLPGAIEKTVAKTAVAPITPASAQTTSKEGKVPSISSSYPATLPPNQSSEKTSTVPLPGAIEKTATKQLDGQKIEAIAQPVNRLKAQPNIGLLTDEGKPPEQPIVHRFEPPNVKATPTPLVQRTGTERREPRLEGTGQSANPLTLPPVKTPVGLPTSVAAQPAIAIGPSQVSINAVPTEQFGTPAPQMPTTTVSVPTPHAIAPIQAPINFATAQEPMKLQGLQAQATETKLSEKLADSPLATGVSDIQSSSGRTASTNASYVPTQPQQLAKSVANQMAVAVAHTGTGTTEITLSPEELGRVRMVMSAQETGVSVMIFAERPETNDLLKRYIETLSQEFKNMGYSSSSFSFAQGQQGESEQDNPKGLANTLVHDDGSETPQPIGPIAQAGLDVRL